jgi:hypothetical protein
MTMELQDDDDINYKMKLANNMQSNHLKRYKEKR